MQISQIRGAGARGTRRTGLAIIMAAMVMLAPLAALAAPFAAMVIDARTGEVLHARNHDTRLHPASLTKMMTLYIAFEAVRNGEIGLDTPVRISANAAGQPCSCLGLRAGQTIALRHLIRAAALRSGNDAATAIGEAISGSEAAFIARMNRTAAALGMTNTNFRNAHGLTAPGHLSSARDMTTLGRQLYFDFPEYYNIFSRRSDDAGIRAVTNTNRAFLDGYNGADGIKTGFTRAAGFNLTASARRGERHVIVTVFGGQSVPDRTRRVTELMDLGFDRAPRRAAVRRPPPPNYGATPPGGVAMAAVGTRPASGRTIRIDTAVRRSPVPLPRPAAASPGADGPALAALEEGIATAIATVADTAAPATPAASQAGPQPSPRPEGLAGTLPFAVAGTDDAGTPTPEPRPLELAEETARRAEQELAALLEAEVSTSGPPPFALAEDAPPLAEELPFALAASAPAPQPEAETVLDNAAASPLAVASAPMPEPRPALPGAEAEAATPDNQAAPLAVAALVPPAAAATPPRPATASPQAAPRPRIDPASLVVLTFAPTETTEAADGLASLARLGRIEPGRPTAEPADDAEELTRSVSTSSPRLWVAELGRFPNRDAAERALIRSALADLGTLDSAPRRIEQRSGGFEASFVGLTEGGARAACDRLMARGQGCVPVGP